MSASLRIGIDARPLVHPGTGNARYLEQMLRALMRLRPQHEWVLLSHRPLHQSYLTLLQSPQVILDVSRSTLAARAGPWWLHRAVPGLIDQYECDVFWATLALLPARYGRRTRVPAVVNVHDLNVMAAPDTMEAWVRWQLRLLTPNTLTDASAVMCLSETTRQHILEYFPETPPARLHVVYPGCEIAGTAGVRTRPGGLPQRLTVGGGQDPEGPGMILMVGTVEPRKNQAAVVAAYLKLTPAERRLPLVLFGRKGWGDQTLYGRLTSGELESEGVYFVEDAPDEELAWAYQQAAYLVFPSLHEGFGLPIIEAYQVGLPALVSDIPIFREIAQGAEFVAPHDVSGWAAALTRLTARSLEGTLERPAFDAAQWSWAARAELPARLLDQAAHPGSSDESLGATGTAVES